MKPYIGILIDSFWEAVSNRVLWALLIFWSLLLLCLAPFGYVSERSFQLSSADIDNRSALIDKLAKSAKGQGNSEGQAVAGKMDPKFLERIQKSADGEKGTRIKASELAEELNDAIKNPDLYSAEAFPSAERRKRLKPLIETPPSDLTPEDTEELNRELLQLAFPLELNTPRSEQLSIGYAGFKIGEPLPFGRRQIREFLEPAILQLIIKFGLAVLVVFIAVIVTSPIIPDTFRSGSLHLLLSKPISRVWLYLSKFFGGTIFVLVNITFVLVGLYFIAGTRFGIWNNGLLLCIPILMFVFIIFYSISGFAGLIWGNAIVCVVACGLFWFGCFCLGTAKGVMQPFVEVNPQITRVVPIDDHLAVINDSGDFNVWNEKFSVWQPAMKGDIGGGPKKTVGPIYDEKRNKIYVKSFIRNPFGSPFARTRKLSVITLGTDESADTATASATPGSNESSDSNEPLGENSANEESTNEEESATSDSADNADSDDAAPENEDGDEQAAQSDEEEAESQVEEADDNGAPKSSKEARSSARWGYDPGLELPAQLFDIVQLNDELIAVCRGGLYRINLEQMDLIAASEKAMFGIKIPWLSQGGSENIAPKGYFLSENSNASATQDGTGLVVFSSGNLDHLRLNEGKLEVVSSTKLEDDADNTEAALVQMNNAFCVLARDQLPIKILDNEFNLIADVDLPSEENVKQMAWIPDTNSVAVITHTGKFLRLNCDDQTLTAMDASVRDGVTGMHWIDSDHVLVGVKPNRVYELELSTKQTVRNFTPSPSTLERIYFWAIKPLYTVFPKPAALDDSMLYVLTNKKTQTTNLVTNDLESAQIELDIWRPIFSNLAFVVVMLGISAIYVARKEF